MLYHNRCKNKRIISIVVVLLMLFAGGIGWFYVYKTSLANDISVPIPDLPVVVEDKYVDEQMASMSLRQKVASLLILHVSGTEVTTMQNYLQTYQPSGLIFMGDNIPDESNDLALITSKLQTNSDLPYLFAIDQEGGVVSRLADDIYPAAINLKTQLPINTEIAFKNRSVMLQQVGMNLNFGIVADVTDDSRSFIYQRVFGGDPIAVGERVAAAVIGANGLTLSTLKHYPGHGETTSDSHTSIPTTNVSYSRWQQQDEPPFKSGINAGAQFVMFGHLVYTDVDTLPASLSAKWHTILKQQDGFTGISITDDMIMLQQSGDQRYIDPVTNAISALQAGNTMLLYVIDHGGLSNMNPDIIIDGILDAVSDGVISQQIIDDNVHQILTVRHKLPQYIANYD